MGYRFLLHRPHERLAAAHLQDMFRLRKEVFVGRLHWDVAARQDLERDCYDLIGPVYGICLADDQRVVGCWRLLPTTGPYMLRDVFPEMVGENPMPCSPRVWEISRFAVSGVQGELGRSVHLVTSQLLVGLIECALDFDIERIVAVTDLRFEKVLKRAGLRTARLCEPRRLGAVMATAGWIDIDEQALADVRRVAGAEPVDFHQDRAA